MVDKQITDWFFVDHIGTNNRDNVMMKQVILTIGCPGSGKSTWAAEKAKDKKVKTIVLNRDDLRAMLFGGEYKYSRENEAIVFQTLLNTLKYALADRVTQRIIIADTNLNKSTRDKITAVCVEEARDSKHEIFINHELFVVPWHELKKRNDVRGNKAVPMPVLRDMFKKMKEYTDEQKTYVPDLEKPKAIIFDLDGTLADNSQRHAFEYKNLINDKPVDYLIEMAKMYEKAGYAIICVSGRNAGTKDSKRCWFKLTTEWLHAHDVPWDSLYMRQAEDFRKDDIVKEEIFWNKIATHYNVVFAVDDRQQVVEMWRRIGVKCLQCDFGEF